MATGLAAIKLLVFWLVARGFGDFSQVVCQFDCNWYWHTAIDGYQLRPNHAAGVEQANWVFFPLLILIVRAAIFLFGDDGQVTGIIVSTLIYTAFLATAAKLWADTRGQSPVAFLFVLSVMPFGFYYISLYTEGLYGLLIVLFLMALGRSRALPPLLCALATAARPTGLILLPLLLAEQVRAYRRGDRRFEKIVDFLLGLLVAPLGLTLFMLFLYFQVGDALAFSHAQIGWGRAFIDPLNLLRALANWHWRADNETRLEGLYLAIPMLLALLSGIWHGRNSRWREAYLCLAPTLIAMSAGTLSLMRFVICNPLVLFALADIYAILPDARLRAAVLVLMLGASLVLLPFWYRGAVFLF